MYFARSLQDSAIHHTFVKLISKLSAAFGIRYLHFTFSLRLTVNPITKVPGETLLIISYALKRITKLPGEFLSSLQVYLLFIYFITACYHGQAYTQDSTLWVW